MKKDKSPRSAYKPIVSPGDASLASSKYFGTPWMAAGENWPTRDGQPLLFVLQLSANQLPEEAAKLLPKDALIQLFYNAGGEYPDSDDASEMALARIVDISGPAQTLVQPTIPGEWPSAQWRPLTIDGWTAHEDAYWDADGDADDDGDGEDCLQGDKLLGHPFSAQGLPKPKDSKKKKMICLYQLDAGCFFGKEDFPAHAPELFAGEGTGHIFISENGREAKFLWTCG